MKVFITGSTGFLGKSICQKLPYTFFKYKRGSNIESDLDEFNPDVIIHSAAEIYNELEMYSSNVLLTRRILDWVKNKDVKMIYFGSSSEYGHTNKPMSESDVCIPTSFYGLTKLVSTNECIDIANRYDRNITIIRPFSVYGINEPERRLIPTLRKNISNNLPVNIIQGTHDFIHIDDFVSIVDLIISCQDINKTKGQIYNAGYGKSYTNREIYEIVKSIISPEYNLATFSEKVKLCDSPFWMCDTSKLHCNFNFRFKYFIETGLKHYIKNCV